MHLHVFNLSPTTAHSAQGPRLTLHLSAPKAHPSPNPRGGDKGHSVAGDGGSRNQCFMLRSVLKSLWTAEGAGG